MKKVLALPAVIIMIALVLLYFLLSIMLIPFGIIEWFHEKTENTIYALEQWGDPL